MAHVRSYSSGVLVGNWWEDRILQQEQNEYKLKHSEMLGQVNAMLQKMGKENDCSPQSMDGYLRYGSYIQIINPGASCYYEKTGISPHRESCAVSLGIDNQTALSLMLNSKETNIMEALNESGLISATASTCCEPAGRNIFQIKSIRENQEGRLLRYGQPVLFMLQLCLPNTGDPKETSVYLASDFERLGDPVYLPGAQPLYFEIGQPTFLSQWILIAEHPFLRREMEGSPVRCGEKLLIKHIRTNKALALEPKFRKKTLFGNDLCLSACTYYDSHKLERDVNIWALTAANQQHIIQAPDSQLNKEAPDMTAENSSLECNSARKSVTISNQVHEDCV